jgi:hypothetical protein
MVENALIILNSNTGFQKFSFIFTSEINLDESFVLYTIDRRRQMINAISRSILPNLIFYGKISVWIAEILSASGGLCPLTRENPQNRLALHARHECCSPHFSNRGYTSGVKHTFHKTLCGVSWLDKLIHNVYFRHLCCDLFSKLRYRHLNINHQENVNPRGRLLRNCFVTFGQTRKYSSLAFLIVYKT